MQLDNRLSNLLSTYALGMRLKIDLKQKLVLSAVFRPGWLESFAPPVHLCVPTFLVPQGRNLRPHQRLHCLHPPSPRIQRRPDRSPQLLC